MSANSSRMKCRRSGVTVVDAAAALGVARPGLTMLLKGRRNLTPEMAVKFEAATGIDAELLVRMQLAFDMAQARKRMDEVAGGVRRLARAA